MSTRGVWIIRKNGVEKALSIRHDAYPEGAGADVIDLIKTTDMDVLYDMLVTDPCEQEWTGEEAEVYPDEPVPFSYEFCRLAVKNRSVLRIDDETVNNIRNSLFCEYAYVVDLDEGRLLFFTGGQRIPQPDNPYGTDPVKMCGVDTAYYPCRYMADFTLDYVRMIGTEQLVGEMESIARSEDPEIRHYNAADLTETETKSEEISVKMQKIAAGISVLAEQMKKLELRTAALNPVCKNRTRELARRYIGIRDAVSMFEKLIAVME